MVQGKEKTEMILVTRRGRNTMKIKLLKNMKTTMKKRGTGRRMVMTGFKFHCCFFLAPWYIPESGFKALKDFFGCHISVFEASQKNRGPFFIWLKSWRGWTKDFWGVCKTQSLWATFQGQEPGLKIHQLVEFRKWLWESWEDGSHRNIWEDMGIWKYDAFSNLLIDVVCDHETKG